MIAGIVLAAGTASRFGATKQVVRVRGRSLVQHAVDALVAGGVDEVVVVVGHDADRVRAAIDLPAIGRIVEAADHREGQAASLAAGLAAVAESDAAVVLLADQPGIGGEHVARLVAAFREAPAPMLRLRFDDGPGPALLARAIYADAMALRGDTGARALVEARPGIARDVAFPGPAPRDVDVPDDLGAD
ncbi:MAG: NTP transferase domain-containing protein [Actinomycetota bacterium]